MLNKLLGLMGAGSIAGLLPYAPWIIAALLGLAGTGGWFYQQHQVDVANNGRAAAEQARDAALVTLGAAQSALKVSEATVAELEANQRENDALIASYQHQIDENARLSVEAGKQIRNLRDADQSVDDYLNTPIPCSLRALVNGSSKSGAAAGGADKDCGGAAAKTGTVPAAAH